MPMATIDGIQVLRAIAAIMVVMHHSRHSVPGSESWPQWGPAGVDIFFVISGFLMAYTTRGSHAASTRERLSQAGLFMRRRVARIVPLYWLALLWTTRRDMPDLNLLKDFLFVPHWNAHYPEMIYPIVIQGWTLNYEMFFYALFAIAMLFDSLRIVILIAALVLVRCLADSFVSEDAKNVVGQFYGNDIIFEFGLGVLLHSLGRWALPNWPRFAFLALMLLGFILLIFGYQHEPRSLFQGIPSLLIVWSSLRACDGWLRIRFLALLGDSSYAIYLFHWASFGLMKPVAALIGGDFVALLMVLHILTATVSGIAVHVFVEPALTRLAKRLLGLSKRPFPVTA